MVIKLSWRLSQPEMSLPIVQAVNWLINQWIAVVILLKPSHSGSFLRLHTYLPTCLSHVHFISLMVLTRVISPNVSKPVSCITIIIPPTLFLPPFYV